MGDAASGRPKKASACASFCRDKNRERQQDKRILWAEQGLCPNGCGRTSKDVRYVVCEACRVARRERVPQPRRGRPARAMKGVHQVIRQWPAPVPGSMAICDGMDMKHKVEHVTAAEAKRLLAKSGKRNKYHAKAIVVDGERFDSQKEAQRWVELKLLEKAGQIQVLERQREFPLHASRYVSGLAIVGEGHLIGYYRADFVYWRGGLRVIEDVKGVRTAMYNWKKRHLKAEYGIDITEID